jgi:hypothetical protein
LHCFLNPSFHRLEESRPQLVARQGFLDRREFQEASDEGAHELIVYALRIGEDLVLKVPSFHALQGANSATQAHCRIDMRCKFPFRCRCFLGIHGNRINGAGL